MGSFSTLLKAIEAAGLITSLRGPGPLTVFAPTDDAFAKLPPGTLDALLKDPSGLQATLSRHIIAAQWKPEPWIDTLSLKTLGGERIEIKIHESRLTVGSATVIVSNILATNGTIHAIDSVL